KSATGLVKFYMVGKETGEEYTMYMDVIDGHVETFTNSIEPGNYTVVATYMGDSVFNTNTTSKDVEILGHVMKDTPIDVTVETNANRVYLTVKVDENATGFVEVKSGVSVSNIALENGEGTLTITLPYGSYTLDVTYLGDANFNKNSTKCEFTLVEPAKDDTPISLDIVTDENNVKMTVTVDEIASGLVKFQITGPEDYTLYADVIKGKAVLEYVLLSGDYTVVATYMGDSWFNTNITSEDFTVVGHIKKDTPIAARADVNGNRVTLTVNVDENATGFVKLAVGGTVVNIELTDGVGVLVTNLRAGSYYGNVTYLGDDNFNQNSTKVVFTVVDPVKENTEISLDVGTAGNNVTLTVNINSDATGLVKFVVSGVGDSTLYADVINGKAVREDILPNGKYTVIATYMGDDRFNTNSTSNTFEIAIPPKKDTSISVLPITDGNNVNITFNVEADATGFVELIINETSIYLKLENGTAKFMGVLPEGMYNITANYLGDDKYNRNSTQAAFNVSVKLKTVLFSPNFRVLYNDEHRNILVIMKDEYGNLLAGQKVSIEINGKTTVVTADENGQAKLTTVGLTPKVYTAKVTFLGTNKYTKSSTSATVKVVKVNSYIYAQNRVYKAALKVKQYVAVFKDYNKHPIKNVRVNLKINGVVYSAKTDANGKAIFKITKLTKKAKFIALISYKGNSCYNAASRRVMIVTN
ncbi:MAG: Ig-like domain-containing protein, partial [Methanobrevibacter sp.]|nr:Ig-like domain-containing protein [Methanobrevibacter sp.]